MTLRELNAVLLLLTFVPMVATAIFVVVGFHRMGYGRVGRYLCAGFIVLVGSLIFGLVNNIAGPDEIAQVVAGVLRIVGWSGLATGFVYLWIEADRSLP